MNPKDKSKANDPHLRETAEKQLAGAPVSEEAERPAEELLHELRVHQIELEMQNEALRLAQLDMEASRDRYVDLYEFAPVGYLTLGMDGMITEINLTAVTLLGRERGKLLNRALSFLVKVEDQTKWVRYLRLVKEHNEKGAVELAMQRGDGTAFYAQLDCLMIHSMVRVTLTDITARKQTEAALLRSETLFGHMTERLDQVFFVATADYSRFIFISTAFDRIWGRPRALLMENVLLWLDWLHPDDRSDVMQFVTGNHGTESYSYEFRIVWPDGEVRWIHSHAFSLADESDREQVIGYQSDITAQKRAEAELLAAKQLAEAANQAKSRFLAAASHDLRQPMQAISLFVDALARTDLSENQKPLSRHLTAATEALGELLNAIMDISKIDAGLVKPNL